MVSSMHELPSRADLSIDISSATLDADAAAACCSLLPGWSAIRPADCTVSKISGGITNILVKVAPPKPLEPVALRVFGENTELIIDREQELRTIVEINRGGFGAHILGTFANGRIESFLYGETLAPGDMALPGVFPSVARRLAAFHSLDVGGVTRAEACFESIGRWLDMAEGLDFSDSPAKARQFASLDFAAMRREVASARALCGRCHSPLAWSHNDLLSGNIMLLHGKKPGDPDLGPRDVQFIDFEYGSYNPRGFDLGNHFNEWAGFDCDYSLFPSLPIQRQFLRHYLEEAEGFLRQASRLAG